MNHTQILEWFGMAHITSQCFPSPPQWSRCTGGYCHREMGIQERESALKTHL